jgi:hypothetical protein
VTFWPYRDRRQPLGLERAVRRHAGDAHRDPEMRDDHAVDVERRAAQVAADQRDDAGHRQSGGERKGQHRHPMFRTGQREDQRKGAACRRDRREQLAEQRVPLVAPPFEQRPAGSGGDEREADGHRRLLEEGRADRELHAHRLRHQRIERADEDRRRGSRDEQQIVEHQRAFAADQLEQSCPASPCRSRAPNSASAPPI